MQEITIEHNRYPESRKRFLLNLIVSLWFEKEKERITGLGNEKRSKLWSKMDPYRMLVEPPILFKDDNFIACLVDRQAGVLLPDRNVPLISFDTFLEKSLVSDNISTDGDYNTDLAESIKKGLTLSDIYTLIYQPEKMSTDPIFYLTKIEGSDEYVILYDNKNIEADFDKMVSWIFRDYTFEKIAMNAYDATDEEALKIVPNNENIESFYTGTITVADRALKEKSKVFNFIDLNLLSVIVQKIDKVTIIKVEEKGPTELDDIETTSPTVGEGTVIVVNKPVEKSSILLASVKDDQDNDITEKSQLVIEEADGKQFTSGVQLTNFPYAFAFLNAKGFRRFVTASVKLKDSDDAPINVEFPVNYILKENQYLPKIISIEPTDKKEGDSIIFTLRVALTEGEDATVLSSLVKHTLGDKFALFNDGTHVNFIGPDVTVEDNTLVMDVTLSQYGDITFDFADPAVGSTNVANIVDPNAHYALAKQSVNYDGQTLTVPYHVYGAEGIPLDLTGSHFSETALPLINDIKPTVIIDKTVCTLAWEVGNVKPTTSAVEGIFLLGGNNVIINYNDNFEYGKEQEEVSIGFSDIVMQGGMVNSDFQPYTGPIAQGTLLIVDKENTVNPEDIKLVSFKDALGDDITDKIKANFTALNDNKTQFSADLTIENYIWPLSFDNMGNSGTLTAIFSVKGNEKEASANYMATWDYGCINPRIENLVKTDKGWDISLSFLDNRGKYLTKAVQQNLADNYPLLDEVNDIAVKYNGGGVKFTNNTSTDDNPAIATISVLIEKYGDFTLTFANTGFKMVNGTLADPNGDYELKFLDQKVDTNNHNKVMRFELYKDGAKATVGNGHALGNALKVTRDDQDVLVQIGWTYADVEAAILTLSVYDTKPDDSEYFKVSGNIAIGTNQVPVNVTWEGYIPETAPV